MLDSDHMWEWYARQDPYWAVLTEAEFRKTRDDAEVRRRFFATGAAHVADVMNVIRERIDNGFAPARICDFGCGVGRTLIPFARNCTEAVGLDISPTMLAECRKNLAEAGVTNATLLATPAALPPTDPGFDLVHSFIVFQHIPADRGLRIATDLLSRVRPGGVAAMHFTISPHGRRWIPMFIRHRFRALRAFCAKHGSGILTAAGMQSNEYPLNAVLLAMMDLGFPSAYLESVEQAIRGVFIFSRRTLAHPDSLSQ